MRYAECRNLVIAMLNVIMLSVAMLNDICHIASVTRLEEISPFYLGILKILNKKYFI